MVSSSRIGIATDRPSAVVTSAWLMPPAIMRGSPVPNRVMSWKVWIMPTTVPSRPSRGAMAASTRSRLRPQFRRGSSSLTASLRRSSSASGSSSRFCW